MNTEILEIIGAVKVLGQLFAALASRRERNTPPPISPIQVDVIGQFSTETKFKRLAASDPALSAELHRMWKTLLLASDDDLQSLFFKTKELLSRYPEHDEVLLIQSKIIDAIKSSRNARMFAWLQLMLWLFVVLKRARDAREFCERYHTMWMQRPGIERSRAAAFIVRHARESDTLNSSPSMRACLFLRKWRLSS